MVADVICIHQVSNKVSAADYQVVDTNGAGDNFFAGVLYGYLNDYGLEKSLQLGSIMGGLAVTSQELVASAVDPQTLLAEYQDKFRAES